ncbi:hypothetical protein HMPREF0591_2979 [Mycobacterium parascrofulaceum ATCC BAA-614]|uniref:Uncharacterized protein n=1 Tax=Mycobacterium parascrofulaceum ATCC BAA-614 TaxID=525368 RepID=D5P9Y5_9MYCO|nr:hypothetical protein HMPREF0591_2979 [Mycobacterium parascrofulaceum ATCC BAA-614]
MRDQAKAPDPDTSSFVIKTLFETVKQLEARMPARPKHGCRPI